MRRLFLFISVLVYFPWTSANLSQSECPKSDLSSCFGINRENGNADWCWANTAADLIGCFQKVGPLNRISTLDVAAAQLSIDSNTLQSTIASIGNHDLSASTHFYHEQIKEDRKQLQFRPLRSNFNSVLASIVGYQKRSGYCLEKDFAIDIKPTNPSYISEYLNAMVGKPSTFLTQLKIKNDCDPLASIDDLNSFTYFLNSELRDKIEEDLMQNCKPRKKMKPMLPIYYSFSGTQQDISQVLIENLRKGVPSAIGYDLNLLREKKYSNIATHAGTVIASRWSHGHCEFRVRDGNGADCTIYPKRLRQKCSLGNIWLSENELNSSVENITWIASP